MCLSKFHEVSMCSFSGRKKIFVTYSLMSSSGRFSGTVVSSAARHVSITSSEVPVHAQPRAFHGWQISFSVLPKSPYCFSASSYNRRASLSALLVGITNDSCNKIFSDNLGVWSFESVTLHFVKFKSMNAIRTRWLRGKLLRDESLVTWAIPPSQTLVRAKVLISTHSLIKQLSSTRHRHLSFRLIDCLFTSLSLKHATPIRRRLACCSSHNHLLHWLPVQSQRARE